MRQVAAVNFDDVTEQNPHYSEKVCPMTLETGRSCLGPRCMKWEWISKASDKPINASGVKVSTSMPNLAQDTTKGYCGL